MIKEYEITDKEFKLLSSLVYQESGIRLNESKKSLMVSRLSRRLRELGLNSFKEYYEKHLNNENDGELIQFLDLISTNKTSFFREPVHFDFLKNVILPFCSSVKQIHIWSSACSSGEEPFSIAMTLLDTVNQPDQWDISVLASDISTRVLARARTGIYDISQISEIGTERAKSHFLKGSGQSEGRVKVRPHLQELVTFKRINLIDDHFQIEKKLDLIFCRNVMIYFDRVTQEVLMNKFYNYLKPGGYLFIGHSETLQWLTHRYHYVAPTIYRK
ncbi:MAG: protein-glutamate O-methyltransferase [Nitrospirae bacterium]|nr:protein-glutamate O-methyltransferase [Nitrospirota bacterium]MBI3593442.1 protein-glutamate O-methyltransferase [Nitrospirota bacterium]